MSEKKQETGVSRDIYYNSGAPKLCFLHFWWVAAATMVRGTTYPTENAEPAATWNGRKYTPHNLRSLA